MDPVVTHIPIMSAKKLEQHRLHNDEPSVFNLLTPGFIIKTKVFFIIVLLFIVVNVSYAKKEVTDTEIDINSISLFSYSRHNRDCFDFKNDKIKCGFSFYLNDSLVEKFNTNQKEITAYAWKKKLQDRCKSSFKPDNVVKECESFHFFNSHDFLANNTGKDFKLCPKEGKVIIFSSAGHVGRYRSVNSSFMNQFKEKQFVLHFGRLCPQLRHIKLPLSDFNDSHYPRNIVFKKYLLSLAIDFKKTDTVIFYSSGYNLIGGKGIDFHSFEYLSVTLIKTLFKQMGVKNLVIISDSIDMFQPRPGFDWHDYLE